MCAPPPAVRPSAGGVPRRAAAATSDASDRASSGKKRPRVGVAPARDSSACLTKTTRNRNSAVTAAGMAVLTVGGEMSSQELLQKRLASELDVLRALLKKAQLISRRGACKGGASGKKPRRVVAPAPARDSSVCLAGVEDLYVSSQKRKMMTVNRNKIVETAAAETKVLTVGGKMSARELLQKRLATELHVLQGLLKKAELISRRGACKGGAGAPTAGKKERFLASEQRPKPIEDGGDNAPSVKRRKTSTLVEQKQKQIPAPRVSPEERIQLACRLSSLCGKLPLPGHIVEILEKQFGDADSHGEIEINMDSVDDSVLFELKTRLDKFAEESKGSKLAEESKGEVVLELEEGEFVDSPAQVPPEQEQIIATSAQPPSEPAQAVQQSTEAKKVQDVQQRAAPKAVYMPGLLYRANLRRQLMEMERTKLPDESIHPRDLQRLGIAEYGRPSVMRQIGLVLKVDA